MKDPADPESIGQWQAYSDQAEMYTEPPVVVQADQAAEVSTSIRPVLFIKGLLSHLFNLEDQVNGTGRIL